MGARGVDLDDPADRVTAAEWLAAHRAEAAAEDQHREVRDETELHDPERDVDAVTVAEPERTDGHTPTTADTATESPAPVVETAVPDVRDTATRDATEDDPARRHRVPTADETAAAVARAQQALTEITARREADAEREARDAEEADRREELTRWPEQDRTAAVERAHDDAIVLQR